MHILSEEIVNYCNTRLKISEIEDYSDAYNGLQVENRGEIKKIAAAVDASIESIQKAIDANANMLFVHHGLFWGNPYPITDRIYRRYKLLLDHDIAVYSCHLPLDAHPEIGNNAVIAKLLNLKNCYSEFELHGIKIGCVGEKNSSREELKREIFTLFPDTIAMEYGPNEIKKVGISSGGSGSIIPSLKNLGINTIIIGEGQQYLYNIIRENEINAYFCGHYATEVFGIDTLAKEVANKFNLEYEFLPSECTL